MTSHQLTAVRWDLRQFYNIVDSAPINPSTNWYGPVPQGMCFVADKAIATLTTSGIGITHFIHVGRGDGIAEQQRWFSQETTTPTDTSFPWDVHGFTLYNGEYLYLETDDGAWDVTVSGILVPQTQF